MIKKLLLAFVICGAVGGATGYFLWNKKSESNEGKKANISIDALALVQEYGTDEPKANEKYLNKIIEVTGTIAETETGQDSSLLLVLGSADAGVQCAMGEKGAMAKQGQTVTVKGTCTGSGLMGVSLSDCYFVK